MTSKDETPLAIVCMTGNVPCARLLLHYGAKVDVGYPGYELPLVIASLYGELDCIRLLLEHGVNEEVGVVILR